MLWCMNMMILLSVCLLLNDLDNLAFIKSVYLSIYLSIYISICLSVSVCVCYLAFSIYKVCLSKLVHSHDIND